MSSLRMVVMNFVISASVAADVSRKLALEMETLSSERCCCGGGGVEEGVLNLVDVLSSLEVRDSEGPRM